MRNDDELTLSASIDWFDESSFSADAVQLTGHWRTWILVHCLATWSLGTGCRGLS